MKTRISLVFVLCVFFFNCSIKKENYGVLSKVIDQNIDQKDCDSSRIVKSTMNFDMLFFKYYEEARLKYLKNDLPFHHPYITWLDNKNKWILNDTDIKEMLKYNTKLITIDKKKLKIKTVIDLINLPTYNDDIERHKDLGQQILNCNFKEQYSMPVFNIKKEKAVIMIKMLSNQYDINYFYVLNKIDNNWIIVAHSNSYTE